MAVYRHHYGDVGGLEEVFSRIHIVFRYLSAVAVSYAY